jgi:hypothetical protein
MNKEEEMCYLLPKKNKNFMKIDKRYKSKFIDARI